MKQSTAALTVWFFSVNITNGQGRTGSLIGNIFTATAMQSTSIAHDLMRIHL
jgi:hypothetical protein